ncbi:hypothetical protein DL766_005522 [Monosporascus sp. MC13-8B]|uniref:HMG box domain-containing protein n=1 Tax=Monosporascus cannonballus TaxID=155416 RepID=A0ABY0H3E9_9PEZI|nr:hypothetical protein DL762_006361 [Monosporascus cannonballus]RYO98897.1 hypothetical protein DL763_001940 [Monosporascus cannonballus]RYP29077.1 hypothetical protein DL766_005522 [Monosporascus sp. MC13-8B]
MLTSIGRAATRRLATGALSNAATSSSRIAIFQVVARSPVRQLNVARCGFNLVRSFATRGRPKATTTATGESKTTTAKSKTTTKSKTTAAKSKRAAAKKGTKTKATSAAKPRQKRKALTDEEKANRQKKELKKTALFDEPKNSPESPWQLFVAEQTQGKSRKPDELRSSMQQLSEAFKSLSSSELQRLEKTAEQNKRANAVAYKAWVESLTPDQVKAANSARSLLKRKYNIPVGQAKHIKDERLPKRPLTAYSLFTRARWSTGEFAGGGGIRNMGAAIAQEWKKLPETEKKPFYDLQKAELERYEKEVAAVFGRSLTPPRKEASA